MLMPLDLTKHDNRFWDLVDLELRANPLMSRFELASVLGFDLNAFNRIATRRPDFNNHLPS